MNKQLPEGCHSDETAIWYGAEKKEDASVIWDTGSGKIFYDTLEDYDSLECPNCGKEIAYKKDE